MATPAPVSLSNIYLSNVFREFKNNLDILFNKHSSLSEEDVRYALYLAFYNKNKNKKIENIYLEFPYDRLVSNYNNIFIPNKNGVVNELDALIYNDNLNHDEYYLFEIKYHRRKKNTTSNKTKRAGDILNDIERLHVISGIYNEKFIPKNVKIRKFFVYLTDDEMIDYYSENYKKNCFLDFYFKNQKTINFDKFTSNCSNTFRDAARKSFNPNFSDPNDYDIIKFDCAYFNSVGTNLKIYEIIDCVSTLNEQVTSKVEEQLVEAMTQEEYNDAYNQLKEKAIRKYRGFAGLTDDEEITKENLDVNAFNAVCNRLNIFPENLEEMMFNE